SKFLFSFSSKQRPEHTFIMINKLKSARTFLKLVSSLAKPNSVKLRQAMDGAPSPVLIAIKSYRRVSHLLHAQDVMMMMLLEL
ncbi:hypothetical protein HID58_092070, partial [Brassica napus]